MTHPSPWLSSLLLALTLVLFPAAPASAQTPAPVQKPLIFVRSSYTKPAAVAPGDSIELFVELHNVGTAGAVNILVSFSGEDMVPEGSSSLKNIPSLQPNEHGTVSQRLRVTTSASGGIQPVSVQLSYQDTDGTTYTSNEVVGVTVLAPTPTPQAGRQIGRAHV